MSESTYRQYNVYLRSPSLCCNVAPGFQQDGTGHAYDSRHIGRMFQQADYGGAAYP